MKGPPVTSISRLGVPGNENAAYEGTQRLVVTRNENAADGHPSTACALQFLGGLRCANEVVVGKDHLLDDGFVRGVVPVPGFKLCGPSLEDGVSL